MDSPSATARVDNHSLSTEEDDSDNSPLQLVLWMHSMKPLYKALSIVILSIAFSALFFSSLPLWRPIGVLMLHKLWGILRFLVLTTSIGLGIINSKIWRGDDRDRDGVDAITSKEVKEDSVSFKVPLMGMFYSELQSSYSFDDKEADIRDSGVTRTESGNGRVDSVDTTALLGKATADNDNKVKAENISKLVNDTISSVPSVTVSTVDVKADAEQHGNDVIRVEEPLISLPSVHNNINVASMKANSMFRNASDDMILGTVAGNDQAKHGSRVKHRRGNSLEFPIQQQGSVNQHWEIPPATDPHRKDMDTVRERSSSKTTTSTSKAPDHRSHLNAPSNSQTSMNSVSASTSRSGSRHNRSRSEYNLNELQMQEQRPRSKSGATSQLARRRNVSLSCDLDKDYTMGGTPVWLRGLPSPPMPPPPIDSYGNNANSGAMSSKQDESSLKKAYTESLAPWRVAIIATPVKIPEKEDHGKNHTTMKKKKKETALMKDNTGVMTPPSSPSTPNSFMGSPSSGELNKKVDAFIARFHERMRLQRLESLERSRQAGNYH